MSDLLAFAAALVEREGGVVDPVGEGQALEALLPDGLASALGVPEQVRMVEGVDEARAGVGAVPLVYGGALLEKMIARVTATVPGLSGALSQVQQPPASVVEGAAQAFWLRNGVCDVVGVRRVGAARLIVHGVLTLRGDEQRQTLLSGAWAVGSGAVVDRFVGALDTRQLVAAPPLRSNALTALAPAVEAGMTRLGEGFCRDFMARQQQRFDRDRERMHAYFHDMREELRQRVRVGKLTAEAAQERLTAIDRDQQAKLEVLRGRFVLHAELRPIGWLSVELSASAAEVRMRRRKGERVIALEVDPLTRQLVPPPCAVCWRPTLNPVACDDALHLLCEVCAPDAGGRPKCPLCVSK